MSASSWGGADGRGLSLRLYTPWFPQLEQLLNPEGESKGSRPHPDFQSAQGTTSQAPQQTFPRKLWIGNLENDQLEVTSSERGSGGTDDPSQEQGLVTKVIIANLGKL